MNTPEEIDPEARIDTLTTTELLEMLLEVKGPLEKQDDRSFPPTPKPATYYDRPSTSGAESAGGS